MAADLFDVPDPQTALAAAQLATAAEMRERGENFARGAQGSLGQMFDLVWNNKYGLTPPQAAAGFGPAGYSLFVRYAASVAFFAQQRPDLSHREAPDGFTVTPRGDGSVAIADVQGPTATSVTYAAGTLTVTYADNLAVDAGTIAAGNVSISPPLPVTGVTTAGTGRTVTATYTINVSGAAPGQYAVTVSGVKDTSGNAMAPAETTITL